ncbi:hypothetical protein [Candidatus Chlamydia sanziniae]|uniref:Uncharacterized protein n=1 Tax=Candidatus Chlamydia sanziniae TaxID=1806891 RepID=A0A1A9HXI7_9CHLA|nr:hypothetical protein [Candidatus Chlamydia sanziniae]ANH78813.1 hypothetical protein Cs308_0643 [Candidatus Chlamydia sanziniae]
MSSWLSQTNEIFLNEAPYIPEDPKTQESIGTFPYSMVTSSSTISPVLQKLFANKQRCTHSPRGNSKFFNEISVATSREKMLVFGSSFSSQLPKMSKASASSPWGLFTNQNCKEATKVLWRTLFTLKNRETNTSPEISENNELKGPVSRSLENSKDSDFSDQKLTSPNFFTDKSPIQFKDLLHHKMQKEDKKESYQFLSQKREIEERSTLKFSTKAHERESNSQNQDSNKKHEEESLSSNKQNKKQTQKVAQIVPILPPPTIGIFSLSYLLTKQGILADFAAYACHKDTIEATQKELDTLHEQRLAQIQESIEKEARAKKWGSLVTVIEWLVPWISIGIGVVAIASGGGVFSFIALFAGLITLTLTLLNVLNGWEILAKLLPGKNKEKKQKIINILQIVLYVLSIVLSLATLRIEHLGFSPLIEGAIQGIQPALESALAVLRGVMLWIKSGIYKIKAQLTEIELRIEFTNFEREDNFSRSQELLEKIENSFENLFRLLDLIREMDQTHLNALRA